MNQEVLVTRRYKIRKENMNEYLDLKDLTFFLYPNTRTLMYEVLHPKNNKWVKPYFDIDDKTKTMDIKDTIKFLNKIFKSKYEDWAICCDNRPKKFSYHLLLTTYKTTIFDMIALKNKYKNEFKEHNIDISVYANGYQKFRMIYSRHETDKESKGFRPITYKNDFKQHVISFYEDDADIFKIVNFKPKPISKLSNMKAITDYF